MKRVISTIVILFAFVTLGLSQTVVTEAVGTETGSYVFGSQESPDLILSPSQPGFHLFAEAISENTNGNMKVNWDGVRQNINYAQSLTPYKGWLDQNEAIGGVFVLCCTGNGIACYVQVPLGCQLCDCGGSTK
ncbi:MAG: hypothetical protein AB8B56_06440 [Crocinitomicaceae bacterium]